MERRSITLVKTCKQMKEVVLVNHLQTAKIYRQSDDERVRDFQRKLYRKAKQEKEFRFYILYDKVSLPHFLREAYRRCKKNNGSPGVDGKSFTDIEQYGVEKFLNEIAEELKTSLYSPQPVKRVYIEKANGKKRPLGIPTIKDRVVQMSVKMVIEPIFEADFEDCSYGFRPKRSASGAVKAIKENLKTGKTNVLDADLSAYFDTIPHDKLMKLLALRISDGKMLKLIKMWLKAPIQENGRNQGGKKNKKGTPQGGVISPLLANIYLNILDKAVMRATGIFQKHEISIVRYADDFVLMGKELNSDIKEYLTHLLNRMELLLNTEKTTQLNAKETSFDFLGHTFRYSKSLYGGNRKYWNVEPSAKSLNKIRENIRGVLDKSRCLPPDIVAKRLNRTTIGWINYFSIDGVTYPQKAKRKVRYYLANKLQQFYKRKSQRKSKLYRRGAYNVLESKYGLVNPAKYIPKNFL